jgi:transposase-like protein
MNILELFQSFQTDEQAIDHLEMTRWRGRPVCPYCESEAVGRHASGDRAHQRWQCRRCTRAFSVTVGTIFHGTHMPLRKWFIVLALMLNAKKSASAYQISRDTGIRRVTVWSMMHRIRVSMSSDEAQAKLLHGIVEADETYIGGKPRRNNKREDGNVNNPTVKGGKRGTTKVPVVGIVERHGRVVARVARYSDLGNRGLHKFISRFVDKAASLLITDEWAGYNQVAATMRSARINHKAQYVEGYVHTNTIESFWALVKRAWYGQHHHYSQKYMPLYIAEAAYKYNARFSPDSFPATLAIMAES